MAYNTVIWSTEDANEFKKLAADGATLTFLSQRFGRCIPIVRRFAKQNGLQLARRYRQYTKDQIDEIIQLYVGGTTLNVLGKQFGCTAANVSGYLFRAGINTRGRKACGNRTRGELHSNWAGGKYFSPRGYVFMNVYGRGKKHRELEHRYVMECHLKKIAPNHPSIANGRLAHHWQVHHINGTKTDNRIENLMLVNTGDHRKVHANAALYLKQANNKILSMESRISELESLVYELKHQSVYAT